MMEAVFLKLLNMSITAGWLVPAVVVLRLLLKRAPKALTVLMWGLVGLRLICPWSLESVLSLIPSAETVPQDIVYSETPSINSGVQFFNSAVNPVLSEAMAPKPENSVNPMQVIIFVATVVWVAGMVLMLAYTAVSYTRLRLKVREAVEMRDNIMLCDHIDTPFILGVIRPRIYLPSDLSEQDAEYVIAHEKAHLKRRDHLIKPFGFALLTVYWFNPVIWVAYILLCRDIELACDEKVIKELGAQAKKPYSDALINCSVPRRAISACPLAFGEVGVKSRIKAILSYKKPAFWIIIAAVVASVAVAVCFLTDPKVEGEKKTPSDSQSQEGTAYNSIIFVSGRTDHDGVELRFLESEWQNGAPEIKVRWVNDTEHTVSFGEGFAVYHDGKAVSADNAVWHSILWELGPGGTHEETLSLKGFDVTEPGRYLIEKEFIVDGGKICTADIVINLDSVTSGTISGEIKALREKYPQYFDLGTMKGLEVYIWQMSHGNYSCGLLSGTNRVKLDEEILSLEGVTVREMRLILSTYGVDRDNIHLIPFNHALSGYICEIDDEYRAELEEMFWSDEVLAGIVTEIGGVDDPENVTVSSTAVYGYMSSPDPVRPTLELTKETGEFLFSWSGYSSYIAKGTYTLDGDTLTLRTMDGLYHYVFQAVGDSFRFLADRSSGIPTYKYSSGAAAQSPVPDGAVFEPIIKETTQFNVPVYDTAVADIDGDGVDETCILTMGPTSGLFTVTFRAYSSKSEYHSIFMPKLTDDISFVVLNGRLKVQFVPVDGDAVETYDVAVEDGKLVLTLDEGESRMPYWGEP